MAPTSTGRGAACWNTCSRSPGKLPTGRKSCIGPDANRRGLGVRVRSRRTRVILTVLPTYGLAGLEHPLCARKQCRGSFGGRYYRRLRSRQYQVKLDPNLLLALQSPAETVIDKIRDSNGEVGGRMLECREADYMIRGLGYVHSVSDLGTNFRRDQQRDTSAIRDLGGVSSRNPTCARAPRMEWRWRDGRRHRRDAFMGRMPSPSSTGSSRSSLRSKRLFRVALKSWPVTTDRDLIQASINTFETAISSKRPSL